MEDAQPFCGIQFLAAGIQLGKAAGNVIGDTVKEGAGFFDILLVGGHGDIPLLHHAAHGVCDLVREHGIVLRPIAVQKVVPVWEEDGFLKILAVDPLVVDGNLGRGAGVQRIEQFRIVQKHRRLILFGGDGIVDVRKPDALGELAPKLKNPILPDAADGDGVLYGSWYSKFFFVLLERVLQGFNQVSGPPLL